MKTLKKCRTCKNCEPCWNSFNPEVIDTCMHCHEEFVQLCKEWEEEFGITKGGK